MDVFNVNLVILPFLVPLIIAGKSFLDHQDPKLAITEMVRKRTIIFMIISMLLMLMLQSLI